MQNSGVTPIRASSFELFQVGEMVSLLRRGWVVTKLSHWNGHQFLTALQNGTQTRSFAFDHAWPFAISNYKLEEFRWLLQRYGLSNPT